QVTAHRAVVITYVIPTYKTLAKRLALKLDATCAYALAFRYEHRSSGRFTLSDARAIVLRIPFGATEVATHQSFSIATQGVVRLAVARRRERLAPVVGAAEDRAR